MSICRGQGRERIENAATGGIPCPQAHPPKGSGLVPSEAVLACATESPVTPNLFLRLVSSSVSLWEAVRSIVPDTIGLDLTRWGSKAVAVASTALAVGSSLYLAATSAAPADFVLPAVSAGFAVGTGALAWYLNRVKGWIRNAGEVPDLTYMEMGEYPPAAPPGAGRRARIRNPL